MQSKRPKRRAAPNRSRSCRAAFYLRLYSPSHANAPVRRHVYATSTAQCFLARTEVSSAAKSQPQGTRPRPGTRARRSTSCRSRLFRSLDSDDRLSHRCLPDNALPAERLKAFLLIARGMASFRSENRSIKSVGKSIKSVAHCGARFSPLLGGT